MICQINRCDAERVMTLYRETPCPTHGGIHEPIEGACPGGSREKITIDYAAMMELVEEWLGHHIAEGNIKVAEGASIRPRLWEWLAAALSVRSRHTTPNPNSATRYSPR